MHLGDDCSEVSIEVLTQFIEESCDCLGESVVISVDFEDEVDHEVDELIIFVLHSFATSVVLGDAVELVEIVDVGGSMGELGFAVEELEERTETVEAFDELVLGYVVAIYHQLHVADGHIDEFGMQMGIRHHQLPRFIIEDIAEQRLIHF